MRVLVYSTRPYDREMLEAANQGRHELLFTSSSLDSHSAELARGFPAICLFVNDVASAEVLERLAEGGTRMLAQRSTGYNNIDMTAAERLGMTAMRVSYYSPYAVAEHAVALLQGVNRRIHRAYNRVRDNNFLLDGLVGRDLHGKTVGVFGTGKIGTVFATIMKGFGCRLLGYDIHENPECRDLGMQYVSPDELVRESDIISLHLPLIPETFHIINTHMLAMMKPDVILINTSRGKLIETDALISALKDGRIGGVGLDVYEEEEGLFFRDFSQRIMLDDLFARLISFPNVVVTAHQAFLTNEALQTIAETTIGNLSDFEDGRSNDNVLKPLKR